MGPSSPYPHQGPGPSSYYQPSPPPSHIYGTHSPGPAAHNINPYQYQHSAPSPPQMLNPNSHHPAHHPPALSPRLGGRGGSPSYSPHASATGAHVYQNFHPHHQPYPHPHSIQGPHPRHPAAEYNPYAQHPSKFPQAYTPPYPYPPLPQNPAPYSPSWQNQPLSPLPKQLSMPPPQGLPAYNEPPPPVQIVETTDEPPSTGTELDIPPPSSPSPPPSQPSSSYAQMGTISTSEPSPPASPSLSQHQRSLSDQPSPAPKISTSSNNIGGWAIWSRRPENPAHAPGIIFSPLSRPPPGVVQNALELSTPPASPLPSPTISIKALPAQQNVTYLASTTEEDHDTTEKDIITPAPTAEDSHNDSQSPPSSSDTTSTVPSSSVSVSDTTDGQTVPGSPVSTNTSVSLVGTSTKEESTEHSTTPSEPETQASSSSSTTIATPASASAPAPGPTPPKKSWASLLRPAPSASGGPAPARNTLPTSTVVGFSIPASDTSSVAVSPTKKSELLALLTTGSSASNNTAKTTQLNGKAATMGAIHPRGLINTGNMCFANSVLQVLVYCMSFHRLFFELGVLGVGVGQEKRASATPLVDATIAFMKEFSGEKTKKGAANGVNGNGSAHGGGRGKGKDRERGRESPGDDDDWDRESFIPVSIYDAMKEKKQFDNMRGGHQEDAEEFLGFYLDTLEEELLSILHSISPPKEGKTAPPPVEEKEEPAPPQDDGWLEVGKKNRTVVTRTIKATESPITRLFGGKFRSTLRAPGQKDSVVVEDWRSLRLDIQREQIHTVQDALSYISHPQPVQMTNPARPGIIIDASQQVLIEALPPVLVLHMKRFCYDTAVGGVVKVGKQVRFGPELEIGPDVMATTVKRTQPTRYKLFGAVYHHGLSASGGHYTLDVLHPNRYPAANANSTAKPREGWVRIDDELVSDVRPEDVFAAGERDDDGARCAYLLFYRRIR